MVVSIVYLMTWRVLEVVVLRFRSRRFQELEIVVLRREMAICATRLWTGIPLPKYSSTGAISPR